LIASRRAGLVVRVALLLTILSSSSARAQTEPIVKAYVVDAGRVESWSFFEPFDSTRQPDYTIFGNRATFGVRVTSPRLDLDGAFQYSQLIRLPERAIGPGALGSGGFYFFSAEAPAAYQLYFRTMMLRAKNIVPGLSIAAGRMNYSSGEETPSGDGRIDELKQRRVGSRLIGDFEWSLFQRAFDTARADYERRAWSATAALLFPTQGGYEESANPTISSIKLLAAAFTTKPSLTPHQQVQIFVYHYRDRRDVRARPDNTGRPAPRVDVGLATIGASQVGSFALGRGEVDTVIWGAIQRGDWYAQDHAALSIAVEGGYRWRTRWRPWLRLGFQHSSGDSNPGDERHETFFAMVPSLNRYAQSSTYAAMNLRDGFLQFSFEPHARLRAQVDVHHLRLANGADRWYHGSGATSRTGTFFGFSGRASGGATGLGTVTESTVDMTLGPHWSARAYAGWMRGGDVVSRSFRGDRLLFASFENVLTF
jgi:hypothetical protein